MDDPSDRRAGLSPEKRELLEALLRQKRAAAAGAAAIPPRGGLAGPYPLSFAQERLWLSHQLDARSPVDNMAIALRFTGRLDGEALRRSLAAIERRHETLRTRFVVHDGAPAQVIGPAAGLLPWIDLEALPAAVREAEAGALCAAAVLRPFDLERGPLFGATLLRLAGGDHVLLCAMHHIVSDGWSTRVFAREVGLLYAAFAAGDGAAPLPQLPIQYADFALWQRRTLDGPALAGQLDAWRRRLAGLAPVLELPADRPRPLRRSGRGAAVPLAFPAPALTALRELAARQGTTLFTLLLAAFFAFLHRWTGRRDLAVGTPVAGRRQVETEGLIGFFVNTLVLRADLAGDPPFRELLARVHELVLDAHAHQDLPFDRLVQELAPGRSPSHTPLFQVLLALQNASAEALELPGLTVRGIDLAPRTARYDLALVLSERAEGFLGGGLQYAADLFDATTAARLARQLRVLLDGVAACPGLRLSGLPLLTGEELHQVAVEWNDTREAAPAEATLDRLFAASAARRPEALAVVGDEEAWSYRELAARAGRLAHLLRGRGVGRGTPVGVWMERSPHMAEAVLAVLAAGGTYVPLDAAWPDERVEAILGGLGAPALIVSRTLLPAASRLRRRLGRPPEVVCPDLESPEAPPEALDGDRVRAHWDRVAEEATDRITAGAFVSSFSGLPFAAAEVDEYQDRVLSLAAPWLRPEARVLEVGCGAGLLLWEMAGRVARCVGLDPSARTQERNRGRAQEVGAASVELPVGFAHEIGELFAPGSFDLVVLASTVQFFPGPRYLETVLAAAWRLLAPGGALLVADVPDARREAELHRALAAAGAPLPPPGRDLWLDEDFFRELVWPDTGEAEILHRTEGFANELGYRYDVRLRKREDGELRAGRPWLWTGWHAARQPDSFPPPPAGPEDVAYVIHTSGSTGAPKGIAVQHAPAVRLVRQINAMFGVGPGDRLLFVTSLCFDLSVYDLFGVLAAGGCVRVAADGALRDPERLVRLLLDEPVTLWDSAPAALHQLAPLFPAAGEGGESLRLVLLSGDWIPVALPDRVRSAFPAARVVSLGGATEATVWSNWYPVGAVDPAWASIPYGRPLPGARYHVLDAALRPLPLGAPGDLHIGGVCLCVGYVRQPELTAERFIPDPLAPPDEPGARLFRTGDRARFGRDGTLELLGRIDHQVKVRGYRIELGEIEAALRGHPAVRDAVAHVRPGAEGERSLLAWAVPRDPAHPPAASGLRLWLRDKLPAYMVPAAFGVLAALPLTPNGKLDRDALPLPETRTEGEEGGAPADPLEALLAGIWRELLGIDRVRSTDSFFDLGGHSLLATRAVSRVREALGVELPHRALFEAPTVEELARRVREAGRSDAPPLRPVPRDGEPPLSFAQQRLWFLDHLEPGNPAYNVPAPLRLRGALRAERLERAFAAVAGRHEVLRTTCATREGRPVQVIAAASAARPVLWCVDLSALPEEAREAAAQRLARDEAGRPFDLRTGPLLRLTLVRLAPEDHLLLLTVHHIAADGWSLGLLVREVAELYRAEGSEAPRLPALPVQYADFAVWQRGWLQGEVLEREIAWWRARLAGLPPRLDLPTDRPRPPVQSFRGVRRSLRLPPGLADGLRTLAHGQGATLFMVLLAGFQAVLARWSSQERFAIGTPVAGRNRLEIENLIGFFVNTLVLPADLGTGPAFRALLGQVREAALGAYAHQDVPFERLVEELAPERSRAHAPLFQALLNLQSRAAEPPAPDGLRFEPVEIPGTAAKLDLTLSLHEGGAEIAGALTGAADLFDGATLERFGRGFAHLLREALAAPGAPVLELPLLDEVERAQVREWNDTVAPVPAGPLLPERIAAWARDTPDAPAVLHGAGRISFAELHHRATRLARHLQARGVRPDDRVVLSIERSVELVVGVVGVLLAGAAFVVADPERLGPVLRDAGAAVVLTPQECSSSSLSSLQSLQSFGSFAFSPDTAAYLVYTSGSTGAPKGVVIRHGAVLNLLAALEATIYRGSGPGLRVSVNGPLFFDGAIKQLIQLAQGRTLCLVPDAVRADPAALARFLAEERIDVFDVTPSQVRALLDAGWSGPLPGRILVGGEAIDPPLWDRLGRLAGTAVWNVYGPSECTVDTAVRRIGPEPSRPLVGRPLGNVRTAVRSPSGDPQPAGVPGELWVGGAGLARGYLGRPEQTAERFVPDPGATEPGERAYRTGDLARWLPTGELEILGRIDHQVKLRGIRIEPGEIEAVLGSHPAVRRCVAVLREDVLAAYAVADSVDTGDLRAFLEERLPRALVPAAIVLLDEMPLTPNCKVDRRSLPEPGRPARPAGACVAPRDELELGLVRIWEDLLGVRPVGVHDDFFALGGHSLLAMRLVGIIERQLGVRLPVAAVLEAPVLEQMARRLRQGDHPPREPLVLLQPGEGRPPLFLVHPVGGNVACYLPLARSLEGPVYGLQAPDPETFAAPWTLESLAASYLEAIRDIQPEGPLRLAGWSLGGVLAFEMALQLEADGHEPAALTLIDPPPPRRPPEAPDPSAELAQFAIDRSRLAGLDLPPGVTDGQLRACFALYQANRRALSTWHPRPWNGRLTLLRAEVSAAAFPETEPAWAGLARGGVEVQILPGDHYSLLQPPRVEALGEWLEGRGAPRTL